VNGSSGGPFPPSKVRLVLAAESVRLVHLIG
jgi:hypothetical protein